MFGVAGGSPLAVSAPALRAALEGVADDAVVVFCPSGADLDAILQDAVDCGTRAQALATPVPVTDAVKRVASDADPHEHELVRATVDRSDLRWAVAPAVVGIRPLRELLDRTSTPDVRPLAAVTRRLGWLGSV